MRLIFKFENSFLRLSESFEQFENEIIFEEIVIDIIKEFRESELIYVNLPLLPYFGRFLLSNNCPAI